MLKIWRVGFDPMTDYFQHKHIWILLPSLSLPLWNSRALEVIGNELGRFLTSYEEVLKGMDRRIGRILVELDIHSGLMEALDIE
jgi:hypothetical protein